MHLNINFLQRVLLFVLQEQVLDMHLIKTSKVKINSKFKSGHVL